MACQRPKQAAEDNGHYIDKDSNWHELSLPLQQIRNNSIFIVQKKKTAAMEKVTNLFDRLP